MSNRKEYRRNYQREWIRARRAAYFSDKSCVICSSTEDLELDHIDPTTKTSHKIWSWSESRRLTELAKCQVLCYLCHKAKTIVQSTKVPTHGGKAMYEKHGCRCELCRAWKSAKNARRYLNKV